LCQVWLKLAQWFWRKKIFEWPHPIFTFLWLSFFKKDLALYLNFLHPRIICTKFDWIWPAGSGKDF
jgi:hypothetical protein